MIATLHDGKIWVERDPGRAIVWSPERCEAQAQYYEARGADWQLREAAILRRAVAELNRQDEAA